MELIWLEVVCAFHSISSSVPSAPLFEREHGAGGDHQFWPGDSRSLGFEPLSQLLYWVDSGFKKIEVCAFRAVCD